MLQAASDAPDEVSVWSGDVKLTYRELDILADRFGQALQSLGVGKGDRVAVDLPNLHQFMIAYYGALRMGAIVVAVSPLYKERELGHIMRDSGAQVLVFLDQLYPILQKLENVVKPKRLIVTSARDNMIEILKLAKTTNAKSEAYPEAWDMKLLLSMHTDRTDPVHIDVHKAPALLQYSGGTTGDPKGAMLTHFNLVANTSQFSAWLYMKSGSEVHLAVLPLSHIYGMTTAMNSAVSTKGSIVLIPDPRDINAVLRAIDKHRPTIFCAVPTTYINLINHPDIQQHNLRSIRVCVSGASPLPVEVQRRFEQLTGGRLVEGYGLTEASPVTHVTPLDSHSKNRPGSIGIPISDTEAKIVDLEAGVSELPAGTLGELVVRGPQVMAGYWNNPAGTSVMIRDGWLHTGDIASMDADGYFHIVDRKKDVINVSGMKVWPREVEEVLYEHPAVKEAAVVAMPDPKSGEAVKAFIVLKPDYVGKLSADDFSRFCKERLASYKAPRLVEFYDRLPKTPAGKILKRQLRIEHYSTMSR